MSNLESSPKSVPPSPFYGVVRTFVFLTVNSESLETFSGGSVHICPFIVDYLSSASYLKVLFIADV